MAGQRFFIISIDGGGIRGVMPSMLLQSLGQAVLDRADLLAGTSTGSIIALGLAADVPIEQITAVYRAPSACSQIFTPWAQRGQGADPAPGSWWQRLKEAVRREELHLLESGVFSVIEELLHPMYTNEGLRALLEGQGAHQRVDELRRFVMAPTFLLDGGTSGEPHWHAAAVHNLPDNAALGGYGELHVVEAIMASAAAPLAFPPFAHDGRLFVDGGVFANNPAMMALMGAIKGGLVGPRGGVPLEDVTLLSLGTGQASNGYPPASTDFPPPYGVLGWMWPRARSPDAPAMPLLQLQNDAASQIVDDQLRALLPEGCYRRVQFDLGVRPIAMNDCSRLPELEAMAQTCIASPEWQAVREWLAQRLG